MSGSMISQSINNMASVITFPAAPINHQNNMQSVSQSVTSLYKTNNTSPTNKMLIMRPLPETSLSTSKQLNYKKDQDMGKV